MPFLLNKITELQPRPLRRPWRRHYCLFLRHRLIGRENETRGRASKASADQIDFLPSLGLALSSRKGTSSSLSLLKETQPLFSFIIQLLIQMHFYHMHFSPSSCPLNNSGEIFLNGKCHPPRICTSFSRHYRY